MGSTAEIHMFFTRERHAKWAMHVAEDMLSLMYAPDDLAWVAWADREPSLSARYLKYRRLAAELHFKRNTTGIVCFRTTALDWLVRRRTVVSIERCSDLAGWTDFDDPEDLFPQLCFAYALRFPQVPFRARFRYEMTVTGAIQLFRVRYEDGVLHMTEKSGEWPVDEDDWSGLPVYDYAAADGAFKRIGPAE